MIVKILYVLVFLAMFLFVQGIVFYKNNINLMKIAEDKVKEFKKTEEYNSWVNRKYAYLLKSGVDIFLLKDGVTIVRWYTYKAITGLVMALIGMVLTAVFGIPFPKMIVAAVLFVAGFFFYDLMLYFQNKSSNEAMMPDIMEMSRSILYGMRGGQYISSAIKDAILVVENERLKVSLMRFQNDLDSSRTLTDCLDRFEMHFDNPEISAFCTVVKSMQETGQFNEAMAILRSNIEREEASVNERRCKALDSSVNIRVFSIFVGVIVCLVYILFVFISQQVTGM